MPVDDGTMFGLYMDISFARRAAMSIPDSLAVRNIVFVAAGMFLWEGVQCILYDIRLLYAVAASFYLAVRALFSGTREVDVASSRGLPKLQLAVPPDTSTDQSSTRASREPWARNLAANTLPQIAYLLLRLSTALGLLSLLAVLNSSDSDFNPDPGFLPGSHILRFLRICSSVGPLLSFTLSNLFLMLRAISIWYAHFTWRRREKFCFADTFLTAIFSWYWFPRRSTSGRMPPEDSPEDSQEQPRCPAEKNDAMDRQCHQTVIFHVHKHVIELYHGFRSTALPCACLVLHAAQYAFVGLIGRRASGSESDRVADRSIVVVTFAYLTFVDMLALSLTVAAILRWRNTDPDRRRQLLDPESVAVYGNGHVLGERAFSPVIFRRTCRHGRRSGEECTTGCSHASVSIISFTRATDPAGVSASEEGDEDDAKSSIAVSEEGIITSQDSQSKTAALLADNARVYELGDTHRSDPGHSGRPTTDASSVGSDGGRIRSRVVQNHRSDIADARHQLRESSESGRMSACAAVYREGGRQGLMWGLTIVTMKIGVFICILLGDYPGSQVTALDIQGMHFFSPALAIIAISAGRLFLFITRASPIGDGFMQGDPHPAMLLSPCTSLIDIEVASSSMRATPPPFTECPVTGLQEQRPPERSDCNGRAFTMPRPPNSTTMTPSSPGTFGRPNTPGLHLPPYVERRLYARRVRREMHAAAGGAVRTIGGTVVLPPTPIPALLSAPSPRERDSKRERCVIKSPQPKEEARARGDHRDARGYGFGQDFGIARMGASSKP